MTAPAPQTARVWSLHFHRLQESDRVMSHGDRPAAVRQPSEAQL